MKSDFDIVIVYENLPVVTDISDAQRYNQCFLMVKDPDTPAGYVKLQRVNNGNLQYMYASDLMNGNYQSDKRNRLVFRACFGFNCTWYCKNN